MESVCVRLVRLSICVSVGALWELAVYCGLVSGRAVCTGARETGAVRAAAGTILVPWDGVDIYLHRQRRGHSSNGNVSGGMGTHMIPLCSLFVNMRAI